MAAIGLQSHIWNNNARSLLLLALYPLLILLICWAAAFAFGGMVTAGMTPDESAGFSAAAARDFAIGFIAAYWPLIIAAVGLWFMIAFAFHSRMIRALSHARPVTRAEEPELYNMLENLCIAQGITTPRLEIIETHARNAFASGINEKTYAVTVTRGLLQSLQPDEVEAVLAHELAHIINRDVRLLIVSVIFAGMIGFFAQMVWSSLRFKMYARRGRRTDGRLMLALLVIAAILWLGYLATLLTRFALSRRREYMADAGAVAMTKNPEAMMRALLRIAGKDRIPEATDDIALMCIENSRRFIGLFTTHPPIDQRVQALSAVTNTPVPVLKPGLRAADADRFKQPSERRNPWLTAQRPGRASSV